MMDPFVAMERAVRGFVDLVRRERTQDDYVLVGEE